MRTSHLICIFIFACSVPRLVWALPDSRYNANGIDQYGRSRYEVVESQAYRQSWETLSWKSEGQTFLQIRQVVNRLDSQRKLAAQIPAWEKQALAHPKNASFQFRYVLAAYSIASRSRKTNGTDSNLLRKLSWHLSLPANPRAYEYDRLRFILYCDYIRFPDLLPLGKRLLAKQPQDSTVSYWVRKLRVATGDKPYMEQLAKQAQEEVKTHPKDAGKRRNLAAIYFQLWGLTKRRFYAQASVDQYKEFLKLYPNTPQNSARRNKIQGWIQSIPKTQTALEKKGFGKP